MMGSTGNHGARYFFFVSVAGGTYVNAATHGDPLCATHINGDLGNWLDFPVHYSYLASPSYSLGQALEFRPHFTKSTAMGNALTYYFNHNTQSNRAIMIVSSSTIMNYDHEAIYKAYAGIDLCIEDGVEYLTKIITLSPLIKPK